MVYELAAAVSVRAVGVPPFTAMLSSWSVTVVEELRVQVIVAVPLPLIRAVTPVGADGGMFRTIALERMETALAPMALRAWTVNV